MGEIAQIELGENEGAVADDLERAHLAAPHLENLDPDAVVQDFDRLLQLQGQRGVAGLVVAGAPLMGLAVGADLDFD